MDTLSLLGAKGITFCLVSEFKFYLVYYIWKIPDTMQTYVPYCYLQVMECFGEYETQIIET